MVKCVKKFKFNEQSAIEKMIKSNFVDENNITNTIYSLAKYNYHALQLSDKENYSRVLKYILKNCDNIFEESIYSDIVNCIKSAKKHKFASIDEVCITQSEMDKIKSLDDIKQEKAIFVILAISKYFNALHDEVYDAAFLTNTDICQMARITIPSKERDVFMQFAYDKELLYRHTWAGSTIKKVTFISHDTEDKVVLRLSESDFKDLAYTYMAYLESHKFRRCVNCGRWMRRNKQDKRLCTECSKDSGVQEEKNTLQTVKCIDCGTLIYVSALDTETTRCEDCYTTYRREYKANHEKNRRLRLKNVDSASEC